MAGKWISRFDFPWPYQDHCPFDPNAIVQIRGTCGDSQIGPARKFWWGYASGLEEESVIFYARQLSKDKEPAA